MYLSIAGGDLAVSVRSQAPPVQTPPPVQILPPVQMPPPSLTLNQTRIISKPARQFQPPTVTALSMTMPMAPLTGGGGQTQLDSAPQSLRSSQTSLISSKPDVLVGGSQADIAIRAGHGYQKMPHQAWKQSSIDAHVDPQGQIAIMTEKGSEIQKDLSPHTLPPQPAAMQKLPAPMSTHQGPLQCGILPSSVTQPASVTPPSSSSWNHQGRISISPNKGGTVSWGVPPSSTPKLDPPPATTAVLMAQFKPPVGGAGGVSLSHSSSAPSLVKPPNNSISPRIGQEPTKNRLTQPFDPFNFGGSTNPLSGELKRSEPLGDLTQIRTSSQKGSSMAGGGSGNDHLRHQPSAVSVPNVAMTTKSDSPVSLGSKFVSSLSSGIAPLTTSSAGPAPFSLRDTDPVALPSQKPPTCGTTGLPTSSQSCSASFTMTPVTISPPKPFTTGITSLPGASKSPPIGGGSTTATQHVFPFGTPSGQSGFTFTLGSSTLSSKSLASPFATQGTPTTTKQTSGGSSSIFSSMPKFDLGTAGPSSFQFSASSSATSSSTQPPSKTTGNSASIGSVLKFPFAPTLQPTITTVSTRPSSVTTPASSLSSSLQTTATPSKPFGFAPASTSGFVFGDNKNVTFSLSSIPKKTADTPKTRDKGEMEDDSESGRTSGSANANGSEERPSCGAFKPPDDASKHVSTTETSSLTRVLLPSTHSAIQKVPSEGVSKTIPLIVKPSPPKPPLGKSTIDTAPETNAKPKQSESKNEQETPRVEQKTEAKPSDVAEVKAHQAEVSYPTPSKSVVNVEVVEKPKLETVSQTTTNVAIAASAAALPGQSQTPQTATETSIQPPTTTATSVANKSTTQPSNLSKDSHPQDQLPPSEALKKLERDVEKTLAPKAGSVDKEKEPVLLKLPQTAVVTAATIGAVTTTATGASVGRLSYVGMPTEAKMKGSGSQSSLLSLDDADTEADMEGEMEGTLNVCNGYNSMVLSIAMLLLSHLTYCQNWVEFILARVYLN